MDIEILYDCEDYLILNKPALLESQSAVKDSQEIQSIISKYDIDREPHLFTRLDQVVSGIMVVGLSRAFIREFSRQANKTKVEKTYLAIVEGLLPEERGTLYNNIKRDPQRKKAVEVNNVEARVELSFERLHHFDRYTLLKVVIDQGKFHQIRAQMSLNGNPIKGDVKYGARRRNQDRYILLHAYKVSFFWDGQTREYNVLPNENDRLWELSRPFI